MIRLSGLKQKCKDTNNDRPKKKMKWSHLRITKDIQTINLPKTCAMFFPDPNEISHFHLTITPEEGLYRTIKVVFDFKVGDSYPFEPPKVTCLTEIYHPNIDCDGNVCLNILREDWKPVLSINALVYGLNHLLLEPNPDDPLNKMAAEELRRDKSAFRSKVKKVAYGLMDVRVLCSENLQGGRQAKF